MTEKRFTYEKIGNHWVIYNNGENMTPKQISDLLNEVYEENEQLKSLLKEVEHELTSLTGLSAYDKCVSQIGYDEVFNDDRIDLDYSELLKKIEVNLND